MEKRKVKNSQEPLQYQIKCKPMPESLRRQNDDVQNTTKRNNTQQHTKESTKSCITKF